MHPDVGDPLLDGPFALRRRPKPIPGDLRLSWGIALILLLIGSSRGKRASFVKLHLLAHSARTAHGRETMSRYVENRSEQTRPLLRFEPWMNRALAFAAAGGLIALEKGKTATLTLKGDSFLVNLRSTDALMLEEREFAEQCARALTEGDVQGFLANGRAR